MPGAGTHTTIIQRLALLAQDGKDPTLQKLLTNPNLNADWASYSFPAALQSRYAVLGAMGPDIFYMMLDYGSGLQELEDVVLKVAGTFRAAGQLSGELNNLINSGLDTLTDGVWGDIQDVFANLKGIMVDGLLDLLIDKHNFWSFFLPLRQVDDFQQNWYWADYLHYVKTGCFTQKLLDMAAAQQAAAPDSDTAKCLGAYALGYLTHYVADTVGHAHVNRIVESPWRNLWQRHHLVENFIDAHVWATWHDAGGAPARPADETDLDTVKSAAADPARAGAAALSYARLNDLCNIGSAGVDPIIDNAVNSVADLIQRGLFDIGASSVRSLQPPDDPVFATWTEFIADAIQETYTTSQHPNRMGRFPTSDDVAGAYGAYRLLLSLATEDDVDKPEPPNILGDLAAILKQMWKDITKDLSSIPPPPVPSTSGSFSLSALWDAIKAGIEWLGQVAEAALQVLGDLIAGLIEAGLAAGADTIKAGLYLINTILYSLYHSLRMVLVMSGYSAPFTEDLTATWGPLDLTTLWNAAMAEANPRYPIEPVVAERDFGANQSNPFSPYRPYFKPSDLAPVNVEMPAVTFPGQLLSWRTPGDMLDSQLAGTHDMFTKDGPAPATTRPLNNPDGSPLTNLETFDGSQRYFGSVMANCQQALGFAAPYLAGTPYPEGVVLPDYNLDSDRGYAWPCWDVDWSYPNPMAGFPWNGCDPFPGDTVSRIGDGSLNWGDPAPGQQVPGRRQGLSVNDPWGSPRSGHSWVNATALGTPGACEYTAFPFPSIVVNPSPANRPDIAGLDQCPPAHPDEPLLGPDYRTAPQPFLRSDPTSESAPQDDLVQVHEHFPYTGPNATPTETENDGRLADFLRAVARTAAGNVKIILANAVSLWLGGGTTPLTWGNGTIGSPDPLPRGQQLATAVAQLAVTGRHALHQFSQWIPQDGQLVSEYSAAFADSGFSAAQIHDAAVSVLNVAYETLWAIRSNDPYWRRMRAESPEWFAVSGFDDTPHRPVNVPTAPYPQYDIGFGVPIPVPGPTGGGVLPVTARYMIASAGAFVGPNDVTLTSFVNPDPALLQAPQGPGPVTPPRSLPQDKPVIPAGNKIIIYIHGGGSRAEEAVDMANWFIIEGHAAGEEYTVISFDLPNSAYGLTFEVTDVTATPYDHSRLDVLRFELNYIMGFIEALNFATGDDVTGRVAAVMGGSLGGNTSLLLTNYYDQAHPYLKTIVSWSVTATAPSKYLKIISAGDVAAYLQGLQSYAVKDEPFDDHAIESQYLQDMYAKPLAPYDPVFYIPPQPVMWYRGGHEDGTGGWQPCKDKEIARSRFDRYEIYSPSERRWITAVDLEQISFSFQDNKPHLGVASAADSNLLLVAGDNDNFFPNQIFNSTIDLTRSIRPSTRGKAEFWLDTGHSIHNERPHLFAKDILYFLANPEAGDSPYGVVVDTAPKAAYSVTDK